MLITSLICLSGLVVLFRPLRNKWFILHLVMVLAASWHLDKGHAYQMLARNSLLTFFCIHMVSINITTFILYWYDKGASMRGAWRISEKMLHTYAFLGGSLSALVAQNVLNHKRSKKSFRHMFIAVLILQLMLIVAAIYVLGK